MPRATGESRKASGLSCHAAKISSAEVTATNPATNGRDSLPAGSARVLVRGLAASISASASRLNAMAAERAATRATQIQNNVQAEGMPRAASTAPVSPNGSVRNECSHLIISRVVPMLRRRASCDSKGANLGSAFGKGAIRQPAVTDSAVDLSCPNTLNFYGLPVRLCPVREHPAARSVKVSFLALVSASAQMSLVPLEGGAVAYPQQFKFRRLPCTR